MSAVVPSVALVSQQMAPMILKSKISQNKVQDTDIVMDQDACNKYHPPHNQIKGKECDLKRIDEGSPIVVGTLSKTPSSQPTIMITNNYSTNGLTPTTNTTTSNSSQITILAHNDDQKMAHRPMVVDQINICINNHFTADAITTTTSASAVKMSELIQMQKENEKNCKEQPKAGFEENVIIKEEKMEGIDDDDLEMAIPSLDSKLIKREPQEHDDTDSVAARLMFPPNQEATRHIDSNIAEKYETDRDFVVGDEVLVDSFDSYCLGVVSEIQGSKCLVQFDDKSVIWTDMGRVRHLLCTGNTFYCVICKTRDRLNAKAGPQDDDDDDSDGRSECYLCARSYHTVCLKDGLDKLRKMNELMDCHPLSKLLAGINCLRCVKLRLDEHESSRMDTRDEISGEAQDNNCSGSNGVWSNDEEEGDDNDPQQENPYFNYVNGRRLRKRQEKKNYADNPRRSAITVCGGGAANHNRTFPMVFCSSSPPPPLHSATSAASSSSLFSTFDARPVNSKDLQVSATKPIQSLAFFPKHLNGVKMKLDPNLAAAAADIAYCDAAAARLSKGDKYMLRGKRRDSDGNIQFLIEWEG